MDKPTAIRRVRIAMSVFFGLLTAALCVLWVRSYRYIDIVRGPVTPVLFFVVDSLEGRLAVGVYDYARPSDHPWEFDYFLVDDHEMWSSHVKGGPTFSFRHSTVALPYWFLVIASLAIAASPRIPYRRFSLRFSLGDMLLVTALLAALLTWIMLLTN